MSDWINSVRGTKKPTKNIVRTDVQNFPTGKPSYITSPQPITPKSSSRVNKDYVNRILANPSGTVPPQKPLFPNLLAGIGEPNESQVGDWIYDNIGKKLLGASETVKPVATGFGSKFVAAPTDLKNDFAIKSGVDPNSTQYKFGEVAGDIAALAVPYGTVGKALQGTKIFKAINNPFLRNVASGYLADLAIQTPRTIAQGLMDKKSTGEIGKNLAVDQLYNLGGNVAFAGLGEGVKALKGKGLLGAKNTPIQTPATAAEVPSQFNNPVPNENMGILPNGFKPNNQPMTPKFSFENPDVETAYNANKGIQKEGVISKVKTGLDDLKSTFTRQYKSLPVNKEFAELNFDLTRLQKVRGISADDTIRTLDDITKDMSNNDFDLFSRKVLLDDLAEEAKEGNKLPNKFTPEIVAQELERVNAALPDSAVNAIKKRNVYWEGLKTDYIKALNDIGVDKSEAFTKENYFRHQVLEHMENTNVQGIGKKLRTPDNRGFTKARSGKYEGNINTDYLQSEYEVMAQMKNDIEVAKTIKGIKDKYSITDKVKQIAKQQGVKNWREVIPEGYTTWQPKEGNVFFSANTIPQKIAEQLEDGLIKEFGLTADDIGKVMAVGGKRPEFVVKNEIAETLDNLFIAKPTNALSEATKKVMNTWKAWVLTGNPRTILKYNIRNFSGDIDPVITANPSALKKIPKATTDLFNAAKYGNFTPELKSFYDNGAYQGLLTSQEISGVNKLKPFDKFYNKSIGEKLATPIAKYQDVTKGLTNNREMLLRYSAYLDYLDQLKTGNGIPKNYGASKPDVINGLSSIEKKAYKLSNDLLGAYDEVSEGGKVIRSQLIPFYSFMEVNAKRYTQIFKNAMNDPQTSQKAGQMIAKQLGLGTAKIVGKTAINLGKLAIGTSLFTGGLALWNNTMHPDLEETLPEDVKSKPHIIFGKDDNGNTMYFTRLGALNDFLEWFGLDNAVQDFKDIASGNKTLKEQAIDMIKSPINKITSGITPLYKTPAELALGKSTFPDVFKPSTIRDKGQYVANTVGLSKEYNAVAGLPSKPYFSFDSTKEALLYTKDPDESAYYNILDTKRKFIEQTKGEQAQGGIETPKSKALYNYKLAIKYNDTEAAKKYLQQYKDFGGTISGLKKSIETLNPLYGLSNKEVVEFKNNLTEGEKTQFELAKKYYGEVVQSSKQIKSNTGVKLPVKAAKN